MRKIVSRADFFDKFRKVIMRYKRIAYSINVMRQSACLVINPITVDSFASLFKLHAGWPCIRLNDGLNIKPVDLFKMVRLDLALSIAWSFGVQLVVFFCSGSSVVLFHILGFVGCHNTFLSNPQL